MFDYPSRVQKFQKLLKQSEVDCAVLSVGSDLPYFSGYTAMQTERLTAFLVPASGKPTMYVPKLEAPRLPSGEFDIVDWDEHEDPVGLLATRMNQVDSVAVGDHMWSVFLMRLQDALSGRKWVPASPITSVLRMRKDASEIARLRAAAEATDRVLGRVPDEVVFGGRTEQAVARDFAAMVVAEGHDMSWFTLIASGPNGASPHHESGDRVIREGDVVVCDFGGVVGGYHSDVTRTFVVGEASSLHTEVHGLVEEANAEGRAAVAPGVSCEDVDRAARRVIEAGGFGEFFIHRTGHGIGLEGHEHPYIIEGNDFALETGVTFSVEPGIYLPGQFGVRIEDIVACGESGVDDLNRADRSLIQVG